MNTPPRSPDCSSALRAWMRRQISAAPAWSRKSAPNSRRRGLWLRIVCALVVFVYAVGSSLVECGCTILLPAQLPIAPKPINYRRMIARMNLRRSDGGLGIAADYKRGEWSWVRRPWVERYPPISEGEPKYEYKPPDNEIDEARGLTI
jgi:hypothetical protein